MQQYVYLKCALGFLMQVSEAYLSTIHFLHLRKKLWKVLKKNSNIFLHKLFQERSSQINE